MSSTAASSSPPVPRYSIALHGGAGVIPRDETWSSDRKVAVHLRSLQTALAIGDALLCREECSPLDAVEAVVAFLEDCPLFNAGRGAVFNRDGKHELEASIMCSDRRIGIVSRLTRSKNPVMLAREILEHIPDAIHMSGAEAEDFLLSRNPEKLKAVPNSYFSTPLRQAQLDRTRARAAAASAADGSASTVRDHDLPLQLQPTEASSLDDVLAEAEHLMLDHGMSGTVGAVAWRADKGCAAATSTGGLTNKRVGRLGDTPVIGASTWASPETMAISCTGTGESIMRACVAHDIHSRMLYGQRPLADAVHQSLFDRPDWLPAGSCGCVAVDAGTGAIVMDMNTNGMFRACRQPDGTTAIGIWSGGSDAM